MNKLSILLMTCNSYQDLMPYQNILFKKYWADCPFDRYMVIDKIDKMYGDYKAIFEVGEGIKNCQRLHAALARIETPYVLVLQEDFLLCDYVNTKRIFQLIECAEKYGAGNIRLLQDPVPSGVYNEEDQLMVYEPGMAYRISTRAGIWDTKYLLWLSEGYQDLWSLEREGSFKSIESKQPVLAVKYQAYPFEDAIHKGKWDRPAMRLLSRNNMDIDLSRRGVMSEGDYVREHFKGWLIERNPVRVVKIQNKFKLGKR